MARSLSAILDDFTIPTSDESGVNVGDTERLLSVVAGAVLVGSGLRHLTSPSGLLAGALGAGLLLRGLTGHCAVYQALSDSKNAKEPAPEAVLEEADDDTFVIDTVEEASTESFPSSDPPSWTTTAATKNQHE